MSNCQEPGAQQTGMAMLLELMQKLRHPEHGCRWDIQQTMQSLTAHTIEEVYEVVDAVEQACPEKVCD
jgi:ATP diphosphatase